MRIRPDIRLVPVLIVVLLTVLIPGCDDGPDNQLPELPPTPILTAETRWGIVNRPYLRVQADQDPSSEVNGLLRLGDIVEVLSKVSINDGRSYRIEIRAGETGIAGWVPEEQLDIYESAAQARTAAAGMAH